jgi:hypothetical protein
MRPDGLSESAAAVWGTLAPIATELGTLTGSDARAFGVLCELYATFAATTKDKGTSAAAQRAERLGAAALRPWLEIFGLCGPASRPRVPAKPPAAAPNPLSRFLQQRPRWPELR